MLAVIKATGKASAVIVGHDVGGVVVQKFASAHTDMLKALVMVNSPIIPVFLPLIEFDSYQQQLSEYTIPYYAYQLGQPKNISTIVQRILNETYRDEIAEHMQKIPSLWDARLLQRKFSCASVWARPQHGRLG